jgi:hypothetical protein
MENDIFVQKILNTLFGNIVCNGKMHLRADFGHIIINYATYMVMTWSFGLNGHYNKLCHIYGDDLVHYSPVCKRFF